MSDLDGTWDVERTGGLLPPLPGLTKRIAGSRGETRLGPLRAPFAVDGLAIRYTGPLRMLVDYLEPDGGEYRGRATVAGREYGRFRLRRRN